VKESNLTRLQYTAGVIVLYLGLYVHVLRRTHLYVARLQSDVAMLQRAAVPRGYIQPLDHKFLTHKTCMLLVLLSLSLEVMLHIMLQRGNGYAALLLLYELGNFLVVSFLLYVLRPQEYSPLFFMVPVPRRLALAQGQLNPVNAVDVYLDAENDDAEQGQGLDKEQSEHLLRNHRGGGGGGTGGVGGAGGAPPRDPNSSGGGTVTKRPTRYVANVELMPLQARRVEAGSSAKMVMVHLPSNKFVLGFDRELPKVGPS
jgi:hypothetical protein